MTSMLERMRARVKERQPTFERDYSIYPFWNLKFGGSSTLRLLPYSDEFTGAFWAEKVLLPMQFSDADDPTKVIKFLAPCREMYEHAVKCPVLGPVRDLYAEEKELRNTGKTKEADKLKKIAGFHWKKPTYYYQGFVVKGGMTEEESPENPIRVFPFNKMIHKMIFNSIFESDEDPFETLPCGEFTVEDVQAILGEGEVDLDKFLGHNFIVKKGQRGEYADWTTDSGWSKTQTRLADEQLAALAEHGLHDLTKRMPDRPSDENYDVLVEMMNISIQRQVTGENGVWNKEWEQLGFKPLRQRGQKDDAGDKPAASSSASSASDGGTEAATGTGASNALDRLKAARGKAAAAPVEVVDASDDSPAEVAAAATDVAPAPEASGETEVSDLAAKIKARVGKQSA
jgi:hypothetical protein